MILQLEGQVPGQNMGVSINKEWVNEYWRITNLSPLIYFIIALLFSVVIETCWD